MDCISCHQAGFKNVVASSGTAFTAEQLKLIKRYTNNLSLSFDMDDAGQLAADRGIREAFAAEMNIKVITLPEGKDPDELIRRDVEAWKKSVAEAKHVMQYYFDKVFAAYNIEESEGKREAARKILPIIARLPDRIEQDHWLNKLAERLHVSENALRETITASRAKEKKSPMMQQAPTPAEAPARRETREEKLAQGLLALMIKFPQYFDYIVNRINLDYIFGAENKTFYKNIIIYYNEVVSNSENSRKEINYQEFRNWLNRQSEALNREGLFRLLEKIVILGDKDFNSLESDKAKNEVIKMIIALKDNFFSARRLEISNLIQESEREGRDDEVRRLMSELSRLAEEAAENKAEGENI
jgi:DNA primase